MFGSHLSIAKSLASALREAESLSFDTVQVFTKNQRQWRVTPLKEEARVEWLGEVKRLGWAERTVAHNSYLINLASPDDDLWEKSIALQREEIERCEALGIPLLVSHPGAHTGSGVEAGLARIARAYARLLRETRGYRVVVCLENTAGGGSTLGRTFEELAMARAMIEDEAGAAAEGRIGFCLDTCHGLAAGYDIAAEGEERGGDKETGDRERGRGRRGARKRTRAEGEALGRAWVEAFDRVCGLERLRAMHLNDSKGAMGSRIDRHAHIGKGRVAVGAFAALVNHPSLAGVPKILETPKEESARGVPWDTVNLRKLKGLRSADRRSAAPGSGPISLRRGGGGTRRKQRGERVSG